MQELKYEDVQKFAKDAFYVTVGLGVIGLQKAQVRRSEIEEQLKTQAAGAQTQFSGLQSAVEDRMKLVEERLAGVEDRIDGALDDLEERLPEPARETVSTVRGAAKDAQKQLREMTKRGV